ncbi:MAG TPA: hypothetical protein VFY84_06080 [Jiangellales bacterium]|nr:hypothetical protein [Jiangellales bacterium]
MDLTEPGGEQRALIGDTAYIGFSVAFGPGLVRRMDARFAYRFAHGPKPPRPPRYGREKASYEWQEFRKALVAWVISCALLLGGFYVVGDGQRGAALLAWIARLTLVLLIWLIWPPQRVTHRRGEPIGDVGDRTAEEMDDGRAEQQQINERDERQQQRAQSWPARQVANGETSQQEHPESDLAADDEQQHHRASPCPAVVRNAASSHPNDIGGPSSACSLAGSPRERSPPTCTAGVSSPSRRCGGQCFVGRRSCRPTDRWPGWQHESGMSAHSHR